MEYIFKKPVQERTERELKFIFKFLKKEVKYFSDLQDELIRKLSEKLEPIEAKPEEISKDKVLV